MSNLKDGNEQSLKCAVDDKTNMVFALENHIYKMEALINVLLDQGSLQTIEPCTFYTFTWVLHDYVHQAKEIVEKLPDIISSNFENDEEPTEKLD